MLLAIDRSLPSASMALFDGAVCLGALAAAPAPARAAVGTVAQPWETLLDGLLASTGASLSGIDRFAIGLGPGSFSGIRSALAFAKGLSLPGANPVLGFPSAAAMAWEAFRRQPGAERVFIVGDARRDTWWIADYARRGRGTDSAFSGNIDCLSVEEALSRLAAAPGVPVLSPDFARHDGRIAGLRPFPTDGDRPLAQALGELANAAPDLALAPPVPLYLHPAVR